MVKDSSRRIVSLENASRFPSPGKQDSPGTIRAGGVGVNCYFSGVTVGHKAAGINQWSRHTCLTGTAYFTRVSTLDSPGLLCSNKQSTMMCINMGTV